MHAQAFAAHFERVRDLQGHEPASVSGRRVNINTPESRSRQAHGVSLPNNFSELIY